jgi:ribose transport system permease protein
MGNSPAEAKIRMDRPGFARFFSAHTGEVMVYLIVVLTFLIGGIIDREIFYAKNIMTILHHMTGLGIVAIGQTFCILAGTFDLSVGSVISLTSMIFAGTVMGRPEMILPAFLLTLLVGIGVGLANGLIIAKIRINPFITTLAMMLIAQGLALLYHSGTYGNITPEVKWIGYGMIGPVPVPLIFLTIIFIVCFVLLTKTRFGLHVYALGGGLAPARLSGVNTTFIRVMTHLICSFLSALAGIYFAARMGAGDPYSGVGYNLESIASVCIAGTSLYGGRGSLWGTLGGVLLLTMIANTFNHLNLPTMSQLILRGAIIVIAVAVYTIRNKDFGK